MLLPGFERAKAHLTLATTKVALIERGTDVQLFKFTCGPPCAQLALQRNDLFRFVQQHVSGRSESVITLSVSSALRIVWFRFSLFINDSLGIRTFAVEFLPLCDLFQHVFPVCIACIVFAVGFEASVLSDVNKCRGGLVGRELAA